MEYRAKRWLVGFCLGLVVHGPPFHSRTYVQYGYSTPFTAYV